MAFETWMEIVEDWQVVPRSALKLLPAPGPQLDWSRTLHGTCVDEKESGDCPLSVLENSEKALDRRFVARCARNK